MVAAQLAGATSERKGGVFVVGTTGASVQVDPQLAYITTAWWLEYATAAKLYNYPDKKGPAGAVLRARGGVRFTVSNGGRRYTFFIRKGFRFSDGTPVTARNFEYAIDRVANHDLASPGAQFITDPEGDGHRRREGCQRRARHARQWSPGQGKPADHQPDQAGRHVPVEDHDAVLPGDLDQAPDRPRDRERRQHHDMPSAGPVRVGSGTIVDVTDVAQAEPILDARPGRQRPRNLTGLDLRWNLNEETGYNQVHGGRARRGPAPGDGRGGSRRPLRREPDAFLDEARQLHRLPAHEHVAAPVQG